MLMPIIPQRFFHDFPKRAGGTMSKPLEIETLFGSPTDPPARYLPPVARTERLVLVAAIAHAYGIMHKQDVILGDMSGRNVVYTLRTTPPTVLVVDVDDDLGQTDIVGTQAHTPGGTARGARGGTAPGTPATIRRCPRRRPPVRQLVVHPDEADRRLQVRAHGDPVAGPRAGEVVEPGPCGRGPGSA
jgi:hypothetical protein